MLTNKDICIYVFFSLIILRAEVEVGESLDATDRLSERLRQSFSWCFNTSNDLTIERQTDDY